MKYEIFVFWLCGVRWVNEPKMNIKRAHSELPNIFTSNAFQEMGALMNEKFILVDFSPNSIPIMNMKRKKKAPIAN